MVMLLLACSTGEVTSAQTGPELSDTQRLIRASLDLRGVRPSTQELAEYQSGELSYEEAVDAFLVDPRFAERSQDVWAEIFLTRSEAFAIGPESYGMGDAERAEYERSIGEEPLRIVGQVVEQDLPWTEVVTADWTMSNEMLATIWPIGDYAGPGWQQAHYDDGRPHVGVLSTNAMWWRYTTTTSNANRKRANNISRIFLCNDYLTRPIDFDRNINLLDEGAVADALQNDPSCVNCHSGLDPIASYLFGFFTYDPGNPLEVTEYHAERELLWKDYIGVGPSWYGSPGYNLTDLGQQIAGDPRFVECAVETAWTTTMRRDAVESDADRLTAHREAFLAGGLTWRALMRSVVLDPVYAQSGDQEGAVGRKMATPDLLASQIEDLTGFAWTYQDYDLMRSDRVGYRLLAGGADGSNVTETASAPNATIVLVQERLAEAAAWYAAEQDFEGSEGPGLFTVSASATPESDLEAMTAQIQALHFRIFGASVSSDGPEVAANLELWSALYAVDQDPVAAWAGLLSVLLRDPDFLLY